MSRQHKQECLFNQMEAVPKMSQWTRNMEQKQVSGVRAVMPCISWTL